jgi:hypothetical protein
VPVFDEVKDQMMPLDGRHFVHREMSYQPEAMRQRRQFVYILTDQPQGVVREFAAETDGVIGDLRDFSDAKIAASAFYIYYSRAELALPALRRIVDCGGLFAPPPLFTKPQFHAVSAKALDSYNEAGRVLGHEPFMGPEVHAQICQAVELTKDVPGDFVEIGVFSGSSALTALTHLRNIGLKRRCWLLDTYEGFQYQAAAESADMIWANTHVMAKGPTMERISNLMRATGQEVHVVPTEICSQDLPTEITKVALANIDVDMYEAVLTALRKLAPLMAHRGIMIAEDPNSVPGLYGAYLALNEFLESGIGRDFIGVRVSTQYFLIRVRG